MSGCATHGQLVGGYVLGALEPGEMDEMRRHVTRCAECGTEVRGLMALPAMLERVEPTDVPPPTPSAQVEEGLLDRVARARRPPRRRRRRGRLRLALAGGGCALAVLVALLVWSPGAGDDGPYARVVLAPPSAAGGADAVGEAAVDAVAAGTRVTLRARNLAPGGAEYELWCVRADGRWISGGTFHADERGGAATQLTAAVRPGDYHVMVVTRRSAEAGERGLAVLRGQLEY